VSFLVPLTLFGWVPLGLAVFGFCRARTAVLVAMFGAWLFLPMAGYDLPGLPNYDKFRAGILAVLLGVLLFDLKRLTSQRWGVWDLPIVVWTLCPFMSAMAGGFGPYEGVSSVVGEMLGTSAAYVVGRIYFSDETGQRDLAKAFVIAGLLYVPLCLYEIRLSPHLHMHTYGFQQHDFEQTIRLGGWRPMVFMQHGLAVGLFMSCAAVLAVWLWWTKQSRGWFGIPAGLATLVLLATAVLCKSSFALGLMAAALMVLIGVRLTKSWAPLLIFALLPPIYMAGRTSGVIDGQAIIAAVEPYTGERTGSISSRIQSEEILVPASMRSPIWGVGRWISLVEDGSGNRIDEEETGHRAVPDAMWVIVLAGRGLVGLTAFALLFLIPVMAVVYRTMTCGVGVLKGPAPALAVVVIMHACDNLLNAMYSPVFWMMASALTGMLVVRSPKPAYQATQRTMMRRAGAWG